MPDPNMRHLHAAGFPVAPGTADPSLLIPPAQQAAAGHTRVGMSSSPGKKRGGRGRRGNNEATASEAHPCPGVRRGGRRGGSREARGQGAGAARLARAPGPAAPSRPPYLAASQSLSVANVQVDRLGLSPRGGGGAVTATPATWGSLTCSPGWRAVCCSRGCWPPAPASC